MIDIQNKELSTLTRFSDLLRISKKDELVYALKSIGYGLPSKATKDDYIFWLDKKMQEEPLEFLQPLCWDSLMILQEIIAGGKCHFVKRPYWMHQRDLQQCLIIVTYYDKEDGSVWLTMPSDLHDHLASVIDEHLKSKTAQMHKLLDRWILGLTNLYGFCPDKLLFETLDKYNVVPDGFCTENEIMQMAMQHISKFGYTCYYQFPAGSAPRPYHNSKEDTILLPSCNLNLNQKECDHFFDCLDGDGIFHHQYRPFSKEEILAAGSVTPDFLFPEAIALKQYLADEGNSPEWIASEMTRYWLTNQLDDKTNKKAHLTFKSKTQQRLYDDFLEHLSKWVCRGYGDMEVEGEFDASMAELERLTQQNIDELEKLKNVSSYELLPAVTTHPAVKPQQGQDIHFRFVQMHVIEVTITAEDGQYFVCYIIDIGEDHYYLAARWDHVFDFVYERYMFRDCVELSPAFKKKYKNASRFIMNSEERKIGVTYLNTIGFDKRPKEWYLLKRIETFDWVSFAMAGAETLRVEEAVMDAVNELYDDCFALYDEIDRSDAKTIKAEMKALFA